MKKTMVLLIALILSITSCKQAQKKETPNAQTETKVTDQTMPLNNKWVDEMVLDNGIKWNANKETTDGIIAMSSLVEKSLNYTLKDYKTLAEALNKEKNIIIKECTMKDASHDNLHVFLLPLIDKIEALQNIKSTSDGSNITFYIKEHLEGYFYYFN